MRSCPCPARDRGEFRPRSRESGLATGAQYLERELRNKPDCNDGRTRVYAREINGIRGLYVEYEDMATGILFKDGDGRVIVDNSEYAFGTTKSTVLDLIVDGRKVEGVMSACPYDNETAGILNRALVDIESAHCHLVPDPKETPAPTSGKKR